MKEFKDIFVQLRTERGYSQVQMASRIGVSKSTIAMWETGSRMPQRSTMEDIADVFNVDMDYLFGKTDIRKRVSLDKDGNMYVNVPDYSSDMVEVIQLYGKLKREQKDLVLNLLRSLTNQ